ncbi:HlyD family secretion protein [Fischerella sp. PCC 9605]|uniref:HlyD family secretion protein n=1 Tax=Fischerella sp. PCC 9605 TaxID=1173024 RepID=UPI0004786EFB|nr:HlyD family efflux transporter periplasmic adaptor subunit [Fischerella sp. PCC 9605]
MTSHSNSDWLPPVQENEFLPPISRWTNLGGMVIVVIVGIATMLTSVLKYKTTVKAEATVRPTGELRLVQAVAEGAVMHISVKENQPVNRGDVIATIDNSSLQTKKSLLHTNIQQAQLQRVQINAQIHALHRQIEAETNRINRMIAAAKAELSNRRRDYQDKRAIAITEVAEAEANLKAAEAALGVARSKRDRYQLIADSKAISKNQLEEAQLEVAEQEQAVEAARSKLQRAQTTLNPIDAEVAIAAERIAQEQASGQANLATLAKEQEALIQQRVEINKQLERSTRELQQVEFDLRQTTITATADGVIAKLNLRNSGQMVRPGEEIAQILPINTPLEVKAIVSPGDRNKLRARQNVQIRVSACPYPDYGVLKGTVSQIAEDTTRPQASGTATTDFVAANHNSNAAIAFYEVMIEPETQTFGQGNNQCALQSGMEARVDIITREETVLQFLLRKARLMTDV